MWRIVTVASAVAAMVAGCTTAVLARTASPPTSKGRRLGFGLLGFTHMLIGGAGSAS